MDGMIAIKGNICIIWRYLLDKADKLDIELVRYSSRYLRNLSGCFRYPADILPEYPRNAGRFFLFVVVAG